MSALSAAALLLSGRLPNTRTEESRPHSAILGEIKAGLLYTRRSRLVLVLLAAGVTTAVLTAPFQFLLPVLVVNVYHRGPEAMGILAAATGAGALVGSLMVASLENRRRGLLLIGASFVVGASLLLVAALPFFFAALAIMIPFGLAGAARMTLNQTLVIEVVDEHYRGRVMSVFMLSWELMPLGVLPAGILTDWVGVQAALGVMAALLVGVTLLILLTQRQLREAR